MVTMHDRTREGAPLPGRNAHAATAVLILPRQKISAKIHRPKMHAENSPIEKSRLPGKSRSDDLVVLCRCDGADDASVGLSSADRKCPLV